MRYCSVQVHHCSIESIMCGCEQGGIYNINNFKVKRKKLVWKKTVLLYLQML